MDSDNHNTESWLDRPLSAYLPKLTVETALIALLLIVAVISRFYNVDLRVMSHDEVNHVVPGYDLFQGRGYRHDPVTHGPMQFHLLALSYFLFGDNDLSARIPAVLFSIATVGVVAIAFRRYLGKAGGLIAGLLFLISPYILFYGRYTRNESFVALFGVLMLYAVFRYLEKGEGSALVLLTAVTALHLATKETFYIYMAQLLLFLAFLLLEGVARAESHDSAARKRFIIFLVVALALLLIALGVATYADSMAPKAEGADANQPAPVDASAGPMGHFLPWQRMAVYGGFGGFLILGVLAVFNLIRAIGWEGIRKQRSFDLLILVGTLILPQLVAFPVKLAGWNPLDYTSQGMIRTGIFIAILSVISIAIGLWWKPKTWLINAAIFYTIFTVLYTTFFTNGRGFWTGMVGSLGYWLSQQAVQRGTQPLYYYALVQIPIYEYLAAIGTMVAVYFAIRFKAWSHIPGFSPAHQPELSELRGETAELEALSGDSDAVEPETPKRLPIAAMLVYWSVTSLLAYTVAGERMPWLTVHITLPMLLASGWGFGFLVDRIEWRKIANVRGALAVLLLPVFFTSLASSFGTLLGTVPPFAGNTLEQLEATNTFILSTLALLLSGAGIFWLLNTWRAVDVIRLASVVLVALLAVLTARAAYMSSYVNYDTAKEYLVYAHAARGPKDILEQVKEISTRITGGKDIAVGYDNDALYPFWWYFRDYPNHRWFTDKPTRDLREMPILIVSDNNYDKIEPIVQDNFVYFEYKRLWWPNQDYYNLTWERVRNVITNREMRAAVFDIWLNRDYTAYAQLTNNQNLKLETWLPSSSFRMYIRKDVVAQIWNYGAAPALPVAESVDPYEGRYVQLTPDVVFGLPGSESGNLQRPRGLDVAPDGSLYVADAGNNRIQHFSADGQPIKAWGSFADAAQGEAPGGTFNEPWDVAVGPDGSVYVSDTWNHRVQKFTADGQFVKTWGYFGQAEQPDAFWGPRGLAVDTQGRVYVVDTGNKRIVIFSADGEFITQFGETGLDPGQFDEPVGVSVDKNGLVYVTDTWNQRIQIFQPNEDGTIFTPALNWEVAGWYGQSLDNKPFIDVDDNGQIFVTDPEGYRILQFNPDGSFVRGWGDYSTATDGFGLAAGVAVDAEGRVWVSDAANMRLLRFAMPGE